jgi:hypothetical protein
MFTEQLRHASHRIAQRPSLILVNIQHSTVNIEHSKHEREREAHSGGDSTSLLE